MQLHKEISIGYGNYSPLTALFWTLDIYYYKHTFLHSKKAFQNTSYSSVLCGL